MIQKTERHLLLLGLHLYVALSNAGCTTEEEKEPANIILCLRTPTITLLRFTSLKITEHLRRLIRDTSKDGSNPYRSAIFTSEATLVIEEWLIGGALCTIANLLLPARDQKALLSFFCKAISGHVGRIRLTPPYFLTHLEYQVGKSAGALPTDFPVDERVSVSWGIVANNFLSSEIWKHMLADPGCGNGLKFVRALYMFCLEAEDGNDDHMPGSLKEFNKAKAVDLLTDYDW